MKSNIKLLNDKFKNIKNVGWIETKRKGSTGVGYTFEQLIRKEEDNLPVPDYDDIEIKTFRQYSKNKIHLFNLTPDGDYLFPIERILKILGYPDKKFHNFKIFNMQFDTISFTKIGYYKKAKLFINKEKQKVELIAYDNNNNNLNVNISWSFDSLKNRLDLKLKKLALIKAKNKIIDGKEFFYYNEIKFYLLNDFETFIKLLENGIISITFKLGVFKDEKRYGQIHDHGTDFSIKIDDINKLYTQIITNYY